MDSTDQGNGRLIQTALSRYQKEYELSLPKELCQHLSKTLTVTILLLFYMTVNGPKL